jgi:hypothetical protein
VEASLVKALYTPINLILCARPYTDAMLADALGVFVFDAMIANPDRRRDNPNCLVKGSQIYIFDHELAFFHKAVIGWKEPWKIGSLPSMATPGNHIFFDGLKGRTFDLALIEKAWRGLSDVHLQAYRDAIPVQWLSAKRAVEDAVSLIQGVRDNLTGALVEVRGVLT